MGTHTRTETHEERFARLLREAIEAADRVPRSRSAALAVTNAEQALMWAERDMTEKGGFAR